MKPEISTFKTVLKCLLDNKIINMAKDVYDLMLKIYGHNN